MSRLPLRKGKEFYRVALIGRADKGPDDFRGLRSYANGFSPANGYDLHHFAEWTPAQKGKLTRYFNSTMELASRAHKVIRPRNRKNLRIIQEASQHPENTPLLKVAFLPMASDMDIRIRVTSLGKVVVKGPHFSRELIPFDKKRLVRNPDAEIARAVATAPHATLFAIQAGVHQVRNMYAPGLIAGEVKKLQEKYDGKRVVDKKKDPRHHHYSQWLNGLISYRFDRPGDPAKLQLDMETARNAHKKARARERYGISSAMWEPLGEQEYQRAGGNRPGMIHWDDLSKAMQGHYIVAAKQKHRRRK